MYGLGPYIVRLCLSFLSLKSFGKGNGAAVNNKWFYSESSVFARVVYWILAICFLLAFARIVIWRVALYNSVR